MSLVDDLKALDPKGKPSGCGTCTWLTTQDPAVTHLVREWAHDENSPTQLHRTMKPHGYPMSISALKNHLNDCCE